MPRKMLFALGLYLTVGLAKQARANEQLPIIPPERPSASNLARGRDLASWDDSVEERRHFNDRLLQFGGNLNFNSQNILLGVFGEVNVWDRLTVGGGGGTSGSGPEASAYVRARPIVWGGVGENALKAFTLRAEYLIMQQGEDFSFCIEACGVRFSNRTSQWGALSAGFEYQFWSGLALRYEFGFARVMTATGWECELDGKPVPCNRAAPPDDMMVTSLAISHTL